jgi:hypothetical protein
MDMAAAAPQMAMNRAYAAPQQFQQPQDAKQISTEQIQVRPPSLWRGWHRSSDL